MAHRTFLKSVSGVTLVELMVALSLMALAATAAFQVMTLAETTLFKSRAELTNQQREEAVGSYIYEDFLADNVTIMAADNYSNTGALPTDLAATTMTIVPVFGVGSRYDNASPTCSLTTATDVAAGTFSFAADCNARGTTPTLAQNLNVVTSTGAKAALAIAGAGGKCTIAAPVQNTNVGDTAVATVEDSKCLRTGAGTPAPAGSEIIFPRFVTYSAAEPARYYTSLIENVTADTPGLNLTGPNNINAISGSLTPVPGVRLSALGATQTAYVTITAGNALSTVGINLPGTATLADNNTISLSLDGNYEALKSALRTLVYTAPNGYFGADTVTITAVSGAFTRQHIVAISVDPNCGGSTNTTAVRMDVGVVNANTNNFVVDQYVTAISRTGTETPAGYYGYCKDNDFIFSNSDGSRSSLSGSCAAAAPAGTFIDWTGKQRFGDNNSITTFLYEESDRYDRDRYSMFFMFEGLSPTHCQSFSTLATPELRRDQARTNGWGMKHEDAVYFGQKPRGFDNSDSYCHVTFKMDNIEDGRYMDNNSDPFTVVDDPGGVDHSVYIGDNGTPGEYKSYAVVRPTPDGAVVPLRLPADPSYSASNLPPLNTYAQDADGDGNVNPRMQLVHWDSMQNWRIWAVNMAQDAVIWRNVAIDPDNLTGTSAIQLRVSTSQRCN